jgi:glycosyltransferase involved in cell wall biosynthesis
MEITPPKSRNDPCPCGSGKRYKHCHGSTDQPGVAAAPIATAMEIALQGLAAQQAGDVSTAIALYRQSIELDPDNADALHMLGVAHMQQFEPEAALAFIQRAADLSAWQIPAMRHNYGWALSVLMSARPPANLSARAALVAQSRRERALSNRAKASVAVLALCRNHHEAVAIVAQMQGQSQPPAAIVVLLPASECALLSAPPARAAAEPQTAIFPSELPHSTDAMSNALRTLDCQYVQLVSDPVAYAPSRLEKMVDALASSGAAWGFSKATLDDGEAESTQGAEPLTLAALNGLERLKHRPRMGDLLVERAGLPVTLSNLTFERELLMEVLVDPLASPPTALGLSLAAVWRSEPHFVDADTLSVTRHTVDERHSECLTDACQTMLRIFVDRVINAPSAPNPLAPHLGADGVDVLKRALRGGLGSTLDKAQLQRITQLTRADVSSQPLIAEGIEFIGFARAESGLGENLRALVRAAATTPLEALVSATDVDIDAGIRNADISVDHYMDGRMFRTRVICVNPDMLGEAFHHDGFGRYPDAYRVGFWFWELERIPRMWVDHARLVDEVWVATDFVADAVRRDVCDRPIVKIRTPVITPTLDRVYSRSEFGLREDGCLFMFSFAYGSFATRKNPEAVILAFRRAFPLGTEHVQLVVKTSQSELYATARANLTALAAADSRIVFINSYLSRKALIGLQSTIDCYLSLHRSEGLGLGLAECMTLGKPVIATAYSGNLEFMNADNSYLVDFKLIPVREGEYPDFKGQVWADASVEHASTHMKNVYNDHSQAVRIGLAGKNYLAQYFNHQAVGQAILDRYATIQRIR